MKITTSGSRRYVQLVESYRDDAGKVKKRTVATLGRLDLVDSQLNAVIQGLMKVSGQGSTPAPTISAPSIAFETARAFGDVWALTELWKDLGFSALRQVFRKTRHTIDVEALIRVMVLNRLCDPESKESASDCTLFSRLHRNKPRRHSTVSSALSFYYNNVAWGRI